MPAYLLTWNPNNFPWTDSKVVDEMAGGAIPPLRWSCGNTRTIDIGSRVFILRQGVEPRGK